MAEKYLEENRFLHLETRLGKNELLLESFTGNEGISQLFSFQLELLSESRTIRFEDILGKEISFGVLGPDPGEPPRCIHGIVTAFAQLPDTARLSRYRAVVSPRLWILTQRQTCRIFQKLSVPDILKKLLEGMDVVWELHGSYQPREYCVQYRETDFNFLSRLMEEEGIFYFFRFTEDAHKLVIADSKASHQDLPGQSSLIYEETSGGVRDEGRISNWIKTQGLGPGKFSLQDYCFENPQTNLLASQDILSSTTVGKVDHKLKVAGSDHLEIYHYPGGYENKSLGQDLAKRAIEQLEVSQFIIEGESNIYYLTPGYRFTLTRHPHADGSYVLTSVSHSAHEGGFHSADQIGRNHYANHFSCIPLSLNYRPPRVTPKPRIWGCQTAVVVGPPGEEIYTDKYGRVKVHFHWDRDNPQDQSSSCWIRVATSWAGRQWGTVQIPRIGQEVVVDFLEGDPDRPLIVGCVYNGMNMPPYELPAHKTQSGIISSSSPGGSGYNQIRFDDTAGSEEILIHAQKDLNLKVENDRSITIVHDDMADIGNNRATTVGGNYSTKVGKNRTIKAGSSITLETGASKIVMKASGDIDITATNVTISASAALKAKGLTVDLEAGTTNTIKGILVKIN